jgi:hypothetical protein
MCSSLYLVFSQCYLSILVLVNSVVLLLEEYIVGLHVFFTLKHYETVAVYRYRNQMRKKMLIHIKFVENLGGAGYWSSMAGSMPILVTARYLWFYLK